MLAIELTPTNPWAQAAVARTRHVTVRRQLLKQAEAREAEILERARSASTAARLGSAAARLTARLGCGYSAAARLRLG